ncbi:MAG: hypothetical protein RL292_504 [Candidatus Parcubacteria bacterium]|jgi:hypothetical protein
MHAGEVRSRKFFLTRQKLSVTKLLLTKNKKTGCSEEHPVFLYLSIIINLSTWYNHFHGDTQ